MSERLTQVKKLYQEIKDEWKELWETRFDDKLLAEGISTKEFKRLFVDKGEVIVAHRSYKPLNFRDILEENIPSNLINRMYPDPAVGGWHKFSKTHFQAKKKKRKIPKIKFDTGQQQRKGGSGWLNRNRIYRKSREDI